MASALRAGSSQSHHRDNGRQEVQVRMMGQRSASSPSKQGSQRILQEAGAWEGEEGARKAARNYDTLHRHLLRNMEVNAEKVG